MELTVGYVRLRPVRYADRERLAELANNQKIWNNLRDQFPHPYMMEDAEGFIDLVKQQEPQITFAIEYKLHFAGVIGIVPQLDVYRKAAEVGYWVGEPYWGMGIATTALKLVMRYAFTELQFQRLFAGVFEGNRASMKVLQNAGFTQEGIRRKAVFKNNRFLDEYEFAKLKEE